MKLIIKNIKQIVYNVEVESDKLTVLDLKKEIEKTHGFDASLLKLLFNGVVLDDSKTLENYKIKEESVIIMMNTKAKPKNIQPPSDNQPQVQNTEDKKEEKKPEVKKEEKPTEKKDNKKEEQFTQQLNSLLDMGFEKTQAEAAIKAAKGQIDLAIEFLYNGIPEGVNDLDLGQMQGEEEGEGDDNEEDPLKKIASIAKIMCQNNPAALTTLLQGIQQNDPDLMQLINDNEEEFKTLLEKPVTEEDYRAFQSFSQEMGLGGLGAHQQGHGHESEQGQVTISVTPEEREVINRLKDLGNFSEADVLQAYFACDKNEELTANYLFEQKMRDDDEMFKNNNNNNNNGPSA